MPRGKKVVSKTANTSKTLSVETNKTTRTNKSTKSVKRSVETENSILDLLEGDIDDVLPSELSVPVKTIDNKLWEVSNAFIDQYGLASMHVDSFNYAIEEMIPAIITEKGKISLLRNEETHFVEFTNFTAKSPVYKNDAGKVIKLIPRICMDKSLTYAAGLYCDIIYKGPNNQINRYEKKYMGDIHIPVGCNLCNLHPLKGDTEQLTLLQEDINDKGGYYILKGQQKIIVPQVRPSHNNIHIFNGKAASSNGKPKFSKYTETKCGGLTSHITTVQVGICTKSNLISVSLPYIDTSSIPVGIVFAALGITSPDLIAACIFEKSIYENPPTPKHKYAILVLTKSLEQSWNILCKGESAVIQEAALYYIGVRGKKFTEKVQGQTKTKKDIKADREETIEYAKHLLKVEFLPHVETKVAFDTEDSSFFSMEKSVFLGYMTRKLLLSHVGLMPVSDRDHTANKRVHTSGMIMAAHFYKAFCQLTGKIITCIDNDIKKKKPINVASYITSPHIITTSFTSALMSNKWSSTGPPQGISQTIDTFNYVSYLSCIRKFIIPMNNEGGKIEPPRHLHGSQWGTSCFTGDTLIMLADGTYDTIVNLNNRPVMTVNRETLKNEPSGIYNFFELPSRDVYLLRDDVGNTITCTGDHKFLVYRGTISSNYTLEANHKTYFETSSGYNAEEAKNLSCATYFVEAKDLTDKHIVIRTAYKASKPFAEGYDKVLTETNKAFCKIKSIEKLTSLHTVYDFTTISKNHTIIANGFVTSNCPYETPEGKRVGLVQVLATDSFITVGCDHYPIIEFLKDTNMVGLQELFDEELGIKAEHLDNFLCNTRIFVNGTPQGYTFYPEEIINALRNMRRKCNLNPSISLSYDKEYKEISISTDAGRMIRGLCILNNGKLAIPEHLLDGIKMEREKGKYKPLKHEKDLHIETSVWMYLMEKGYVELIDKAEEENLNVAIYPSDLDAMSKSDRIQYTHCEMTPDMIEGIGANTSPKNDCNQAPRNIYQSAMAKQSIGVPGLNHRYYKKGKWHALVYPQKPIVNTRIAKKAGLDNVPMGQNATVLVMPWYGFNQEDSLVLNKDAVDRGFMCSYAYVGYEATIKNPNLPGASKYQEFKIPVADVCNDYRGNASKLVSDGKWCYVPKGTEVSKGDILIGMVLTYSSNVAHIDTSIHNKKVGAKFETNISVIYDQKWPSTVHSVTCGKNGDGYMCIRIVTRQYRKPVRGDKFAARHGQKGTVGELLPSEEMPFLVRLGYTPNILMNPLAYPSRMTIGLFVEAVMGISLTSSALKCPEYSMPLFLDGTEDRPKCTTTDVDPEDLFYPEGFDPQKDYAMSLDGDASPFIKSFNHKYILQCIEKLGVPGFSEEEIIIPKTGERLQRLIFHGVMYYQRLKHMVVDKIHARATGSNHALHRQPTEGRKKKGGFRVGHMERDSLLKSTPIELREGFSIYLGHFKVFKKEKVWSMNSNRGGVEKSSQTLFGMGNSKDVYMLTLQDGRTVKGSPNHPFCIDDENFSYTEMHDLKPDVDRVACSLNGPLVNFLEDIKLCTGWIWDVDFFQSIHENDVTLSKYEAFRNSLRLARLMGLVCTDGYVPIDEKNVTVHPDHKIDVQTVKDDILKLTGIVPITKRLKFIPNSVEIPDKLSDAIKQMGIVSGARVTQRSYFPEFIDKDTPLPILREFLGGLFGGDGHTVCLSVHHNKKQRDLMKSVQFSWTRDGANTKSLINNLKVLKELLSRFNIKSTVQNPKETTASKQSGGRYVHKEVVLGIPIADLIPFSEKIGFRYCVHKSLRLAAGVSYRRFREGVLRQRMEICERVDEITNYREKKKSNCDCSIPTKKAIEEATEELISREALLHKRSIPDHRVLKRLLEGKNNELRCEKNNFPDVEEYLTSIGAIQFFDDQKNDDNKSAKCCIDRNSSVVPVFYLRVIDVRNCNEKADMYDITVPQNESYLANGVVAHNCMLAQGTPEMVQDRLLYQSDVYKQPVCQVCGLPAIDDGEVKYCRVCQTSKIVYVQLPFGTKLLSQEFSVLNMVPRIITLPEKI